MPDDIFGVISFDTSHQAIAAELAVTGLPDARLIPLPPEISEGCGLALRVNHADTDKTAALLNAKGLLYQHIYELSLHGSARRIRKLL